MEAKFITTKEMLAIMNKCDHNQNPIPFDLTYVTADRDRNTGGKIKTAKSAYMPAKEKTRVDKSNRSTPAAQNHFRHATRNIKTPDGNLHKIHIFLVTKFNGISVI
jgi:hypothetical protein